jgi:RNA polymerase sigma-70 factor (ECF subfamily)
MTALALGPTRSIRLAPSWYQDFVTSERAEDAALVAGVVDGDQTALESIYRNYGGAVKFVARKVLKDDALAEDVVQDVFVSFWKAPAKFDADRGSLRTYLLTIAHRRAVDVVRSEEARTRRQDATSLEETVDLEHEVWVRNQSEKVREAVAGLGEDERKAISLAYFGGLTYVEVAKQLDEPEGTVKSRIRSGMKKLSTALAEVAQ